jgi:hypothetical protein
MVGANAQGIPKPSRKGPGQALERRILPRRLWRAGVHGYLAVMEHAKVLVRCVTCGLAHIALSEEELRDECGGETDLEVYRRCARCGSSLGFRVSGLRVDELGLAPLHACLASSLTADSQAPLPNQ